MPKKIKGMVMDITFCWLSSSCEETVGGLIARFDGPDRAVGLKQTIKLGDHRLRIDPRRERHYGVVECAFHVEGRFRGSAVDPQNGIIAGHRVWAAPASRRRRIPATGRCQ